MEPGFSQEEDTSSSGAKSNSRRRKLKKSRDNKETDQISTVHDTRQDEYETKDTTLELKSQEDQALEATGVKRKIRKQKKKKRSSQNMKEESQKETVDQPSKEPVTEESETEEEATNTWYKEKSAMVKKQTRAVGRVPNISRHIFKSTDEQQRKNDYSKVEYDCCRVSLDDDFCIVKENHFLCRNSHQNLSKINEILPTVVQKYKITTRFLNHRMHSYVFLCTLCKAVEFDILQMEEHLHHHATLRQLPCEKCCQDNTDISIIIKEKKYDIPLVRTRKDGVLDFFCTNCKERLCLFRDMLRYGFDVKFLKIAESNDKTFKIRLAFTCHFCWRTFRFTGWGSLVHHLKCDDNDKNLICINCFLDMNLIYAMASLNIDE